MKNARMFLVGCLFFLVSLFFASLAQAVTTSSDPATFVDQKVNPDNPRSDSHATAATKDVRKHKSTPKPKAKANRDKAPSSTF